MSPESIFNFANSSIIIGWFLLLALPSWKHTQTIVLSGVILVFAMLYSFTLLKGIGTLDLNSFSTLAGVKVLFQSDQAVAMGWVHYLAFDLFVGAYIVRKSQELGIRRFLYSLCLPFTFMFGPLGYFIFFIFKTLKTKSLAA
jgi:Domain of unknown function (DUF4281)